MNNSSSFTHNFDVDLCTKYGMPESVLIHHFQYWIRHNKALKRNFFEGRYWTYQTREEIAAYFPYWTPEKVRRYLESLVKKGVLIKGNFNKTPFDRTIWYAFKDEDVFINSKDSYVGPKCQMERSDLPNQLVQLAQPIPDSITDTKTKEERPSACSHPEAGNVSLLLLEAIKKTKPDIKEPTFHSMHQEMAKMLSIDKRNIETVRKLIAWLPTSEFWSRNILSADKFRKQFDRLELEMNKQPNASKRPSDDLQLIKKLEQYLHSHPRSDIAIGPDYVDFTRLRDSCYKAGEPGFKDKVLNSLRKLGINVK